ncbi:multidrug efflux system membrane fusion protein [Rhodovulum bhavnagarense]|uniref:Multidrug efflux system membrane fusion protein n=2 Tax=Rhodovulum bhavnagarense TaxID=992286 RepID=A0A4R2RIA4_9RHOB|nr:multidrug efflux system membrane fusion protein [Rhodovulum bhavnagarense]
MLTAVLVTLSLYLLLMERDRVMVFAGAEPAPPPAPALHDKAPSHRVPVMVLDSAAREVQGHVLIRGETAAAREVEIRAETSGRVISEPLRRGAMVGTGDTLCQLDPGTRAAALAQAEAGLAEARLRLPEAEARVNQATATLEEARLNDRAARSLAESGFASETRVAATTAAVSSAEAALASARAGLEAAQTGIRTAEAQLAVARTEIARLTIAAPFDGVLETDAAELGALLQPGALCARVIQLDPIRLVGHVPETDLARIRPGAMASGRLSSGQEVSGRVRFVGRTADETTRTFRVEAEIANADGTIRAGQTVEIRIQTPTEQAHLLPQSALTLDNDGRLGVRLAAPDGTARFAPVKVLRDTVAGVWVSGLPERADVIVTGQEFVTDGVPLDITYRERGQ